MRCSRTMGLVGTLCFAACGESSLTPDVRADARWTDVSIDASSADVSLMREPDSAVDVLEPCRAGQTRCGERCVDTDVDEMNCGACETRCSEGRRCVMGSCVCEAGQRLCDGACIDPQSDAMHCGACGARCPAGQMCVRGACRVDCPIPGVICGSGAMMMCVDATSDPAHCGGCGNACPTPSNGTAACVLGMCGVGACDRGYADCDRSATNGCEVQLASATNHCGACGNVCSPRANAAPACVMGACALGPCNAGFANCDGVEANGCEVQLQSDARHCGACGRACALANATAGCSAGACVVATCSANFGNCDGQHANGCETDLRTSSMHCGGCGRPCAAGSSCEGGMCTAPMTTINFPSASSTVGVSPMTTLGAVGGNRYFRAGDYVTETFSRAASTSRLDINFTMIDLTEGCASGQPLSWNVLVNGMVVGTFGWTGGSGVSPRSVIRSYSFAAVPAGAVTLRFEATTTVCPGGNSWVWQAGTATLR